MRRTDVVVLGSGHEERNARWADSRRSYDAGYGIKSIADLYQVIAFFEERRGRLYGFRWKDRTDYKSCAPAATPAATDQEIGAGDGETASFQLRKVYGATFSPYARAVSKPVAGSVLVAVNDAPREEATDFVVDTTNGIVTFLPGREPGVGETVTAGFEFDVPVRFDTDELRIDLSSFDAGQIQNIPIVEVKP